MPFSAVNVCNMTVGTPPKPSQTFIMTKDIALELSMGPKPSIHTARARTVILHTFTAEKGTST